MNLRHLLYIIMCMVGLTAQADNILSLPHVAVDYNKTIQLPLALDNTTDVVALQFTIEVPSGVTLDPSSAVLTDRADGHVVSVRRMATGRYMGMIYSSRNKPLRGRSGSVMTINLTANTTIHDGAEYPLTLSDVLISDAKGTNVSSTAVSGSLTISQAADFCVQSVSCVETSASPEDILHLNWQISNVGATATMDGWREQIYLDGADGQSKLLTTLYATDLLSPNQTISRQADVRLPRILGVNGAARVRIVLIPSSQSGEPAWYTANNTVSSTTLSVSRHLYLTPSEAHISESSASMVRLQLTRSGSTQEAETFTLQHNADARLTLPTEVTIPAGQSSTYFYVQVTPNHTLDDAAQTTLRLCAEGYDEVTGLFTIEDDTKPTLTLTPSAEEVSEGESLHFVLTTERAPVEDLSVILSSNLSKRFNLPQVIIPAGSTSVDFDIEALDDAIPDVEQSAIITASAQGYAAGKYVIVLTDNDVPTLTLSLSPNAVSESAGPQAVTATLRRIDNTQSVVKIRLSDDSDGGVYYPRQSFTMEKGIETITFNLGPIDNSLVDGERVVNITAAVFISSCGCSATNGDNGGIVTVPLTIYDNDGPSITLSTSSSSLREGHSMEVSVSRNTATDAPLTVSLSSDHDSALTYPKSVTIPIGSRTATFTVESIGNETQGDSFTAVLTATAPEHSTANAWFSVSDQTLPDARISSLTASTTEVEVGSVVEFTATVVNEGVQPLPRFTSMSLYRANDHAKVAEVYTQKAIEVGESMQLVLKATTRMDIGQESYYATVNERRVAEELCYTNNSSDQVTIDCKSPYNVLMSVSPTICKKGEAVSITGHVKGHYTAGDQVELYIINEDYRDIVFSTIEEDGSFSYSYTPYDVQIGHFSVGGCYPGERVRTEMAAFDINGLRLVANSYITCRMYASEEFTTNVAILNPGNIDISGAHVSVTQVPEGWSVCADMPQSIGARSTVNVNVNLTADDATIGSRGEQVHLLIETKEGITLPIVMYCHSDLRQAKVRASVTTIQTTMIKGQTRDYQFVLHAEGRGTTGKIKLALEDWMSTVTPSELPSMSAGDSAVVILRLKPTDDMPLNAAVTGQIGVNCTLAESFPIPYSITTVGTNRGTLTIDACDDNTYFAEKAPHVEGATVKVYLPTDMRTPILAGHTDTNGIFSTELQEGWYRVVVSAEEHEDWWGDVSIDPERETLKTVNLFINGIQMNFSVEETEVEDEYHIEVKTTFKTNVPAPVVTLTCLDKVDGNNMKAGDQQILRFIFTNHGLISAHNVYLSIPKPSETWNMRALDHTEPFELEAGQSITVTTLLTKKELVHNTRSKINTDIDMNDVIYSGKSTFDQCMAHMYAEYEQICGKDMRSDKVLCSLALQTCAQGAIMESLNNLISQLNLPTFPGMLGGGPSFDGTPNTPDYGSNTNQPLIGIEKALTFCDPNDTKCASALIEAMLSFSKGFSAKSLKNLSSISKKLVHLSNKYEDALKEGKPTEDVEKEFVQEILVDCAQKIWETLKNAQEAINEDSTIKDIAVSYESESRKKGKKDDGNDVLSQIKGFYDKSLTIMEACENSYNKLHPRDGEFDIYRTIQDLCLYLDNLSKLYSIFFKDGELQYYNPFTIREFIQLVNDTPLSDINDDFIADHAPYDMDIEDAQKLAINWKKSVLRWEELKKDIANNPETQRKSIATVSKDEDDDYIDFEMVAELCDELGEIDKHAQERGYESIVDEFTAEYSEYLDLYKEPNRNVCASVSLKFSQDLKMTRQAFKGTLSVFNGHESNSMQDVRVEVYAMDADGVMSTSHTMQITPQSMKGFEGELEGTEGWSLAAQSNGEYVVEFLPTRFAAPEVPTPWNFGGRVTYIDPFTGAEVTRELTPVTLTVNPSPELQLTYFMQRDVFGDDPTTPNVIEPSRETEFALLIKNVGYGDAHNVSLTTSAPQIVENEKGLLVDFIPKYSKREGKDTELWLSESIPLQLGTIPAKTTTYAQWFFESKLMGQMADYDVNITHVTSHNNPELTLIPEDGIKIRTLVRSLEVSDGVGFMTDDLPDADDAPDHLYLSNGTDEDVSVAHASCTRLNDTQLRITVVPSADGWNYVKVADPFYGKMVIASIVRESDQEPMPLRNFWQTDRTLREGKDPLAEDIIHLATCFEGPREDTFLITMERAEVAAPKASLASGSVVEKGTTVTLSSDTPDATIYYTTDGSCPCDETTRLEYTAPIVIDQTMIIRAIAVATDLTESEIVEFTYTVVPAVGIDEVTLDETIKVYPLPVRDKLNVTAGGEMIKSVTIVSANGSVVDKAAKPETLVTLNVSHLAPGIYFINVATEDKNYSRKIMKVE